MPADADVFQVQPADLDAMLGDASSWRSTLASCREDQVRARRLADELRREAHARGDARGVARALVIEGGGAWPAGAYEDAVRSLDGALRQLDHAEAWASKDPSSGPSPTPERATALSELGVVGIYVGDYVGALERLREALDMWRALGDEVGEADALNRIGMLFLHRGEMAEAREAYEACLAIRERLAPVADLAGTHNNLAKVLTELGEFDAALARLERACRLWEEVDDRRGLAMALNNAGVVLERRGDLAAAAAYFEASIALKDARGDPHGASESRRRLGRLRLREGEVGEAVALLERAAADAESIGARDELAPTCEALADAYEAAGDLAAALRWHRRLREVERELFDAESDQRLRGLQVQHQLDRAVRESNTDALTGLPNRRAVDRRLREELASARARGRPLSVAIADLDFFKWVNDHCSHAVGDVVLRTVAGIMREQTRSSDTVARYGGEEFVVLLPGCDRDEAVEVVEHIGAEVRRYDWRAIHPDLVVTVSVGVTCTDGDAEPDAVLAAADEHLYRAKRDGKDRVRA